MSRYFIEPIIPCIPLIAILGFIIVIVIVVVFINNWVDISRSGKRIEIFVDGFLKSFAQKDFLSASTYLSREYEEDTWWAQKMEDMWADKDMVHYRVDVEPHIPGAIVNVIVEIPVKTVATTLLSREEFSKPAITPLTISVV